VGGLRELERPVEAPEVVAGIRVGVEQHIGGHGVGKDRRPTRQVRGGLDPRRVTKSSRPSEDFVTRRDRTRRVLFLPLDPEALKS
jgi:hypothetical protein